MKTAAAAAIPAGNLEIFNRFVRQMIWNVKSSIESSEWPPEEEQLERQKLAVLNLVARMDCPFSDFLENLSAVIPDEVITRLYDLIDALSALYDVCTGKGN